MKREAACSRIEDVISGMDFHGKYVGHFSYGNGHINDTFVVLCEDKKDQNIKYLLQRINHEVFKNPLQLIENIDNVTAFLRKKIISNGGDFKRETLNVVPTSNKRSYYVDSLGNYWRCYLFIHDTVCFDIAVEPDHFYQSGYLFGKFQRLLADYPANTLHETIKGFHHTKMRLEAFKKAIKDDVCGRAKYVQDEIEFALAREDETGILVDLMNSGELPVRVTHNDTKLNNILFDKSTGEALCIVDLDTVMPGLVMYDFGDSIRFGASTGAEDERDLSKIFVSLDLFDVYTKGFLKGCAGVLTNKEIDMLPIGAKLMTFECGIRFLTDFLQGDTYFKIHRDYHNLDRSRTQFKLVSDMESKWSKLHEIVNKYR